MASQGYIHSGTDRYMAHNEQSALFRVKETYWTTKQAVMKKLGKKEDEHIVASDAELDAKLEQFRAIQRSCMEMLRAIERYQDRLCALAQEENSMGRYLKNHSQSDKTRAGKMMGAVGKAQSFSSQQRLALRVPLVRLYQEVETFRYRAVADMMMTVNRMEAARTEYRGALLWMKDATTQLDPDTYKQMDKFRKVQAQVKKTKAKFDKLKFDTMQKIDLLSASRCNLFSNVLATYQSTLLHYWEKTSRTMTTVADSFKGFQYYEFSMLKELCEPSKRLAEETGADDEQESLQDRVEEQRREAPSSDEELSSFEGHGPDLLGSSPAAESVLGLVQLAELAEEAEEAGPQLAPAAAQSSDLFLDFGEEEAEESIEEIKKKQDMEFDFDEHIKNRKEAARSGRKGTEMDALLTDELDAEDATKEGVNLLSDILDSQTSNGDFSSEWQNIFGSAGMAASVPSPTALPTRNVQDFMPSNLLDMDKLSSLKLSSSTDSPAAQLAADLENMGMGHPQVARPPASLLSASMGPPPSVAPPQYHQVVAQAPLVQHPKSKQAPQLQNNASKASKSDMSAWFDLFADLDPLANPDAVGRSAQQSSDNL